MNVNQKYFLYLIIIFFLSLQVILARPEIRFSSKQNSLNNSSSDFHHSFFNECQAERAARQRQQYYVAYQEELSQKEVRLRIVPSQNSGSNKVSKLANPTNNPQNNSSKNNLPNPSTTPKKLPNNTQNNIVKNNPPDLPQVNELKEILTIDYPKETQEQIIASQKIALFAARTVEVLKSRDTMSQGLDMLAITSMANKLNKQNDPWLAVELMDQYLESSKLISNPAWTNDVERKDLNINLVNFASSISYASMLESRIPESLSACSGFTSAAMQLTRNENVSLDIPKKLQALSENIISVGSQLAKVAISAEKRSLYLAFDYFINPLETASKLFVGGVLGAARAVKNFNPIETACTISHSVKDGVKFLANFVIDLDLDHEVWLKNYDCSEKVSLICHSIENATTEQIGEVLGEGVIDQLLFDKTLKIVGKSVSILAASVKRTIKPGTKIHDILTTLKDASEFSKPELEIIAATEGGAETIVFKEAAEEITKDLSNFSQNSNIPANSSVRTAAQISKLTDFQNGVTELTSKYGKKILDDAQQALRVSETKIINNDVPQLLEKLEKISEDIKYIIESKPHRAGFIYDISEAGKVTEGSVLESLAACAAEDSGIVHGELLRATDSAYDFIDKFGNKWDVKTPFSKTVDFLGKKFDAKKFLEKSIRKTIDAGELVLLDTTYLVESDINALRELLYLEERLLAKTKFLSRNLS